MTKKELLESKAFMEAPDDAYIEMPNGHCGVGGDDSEGTAPSEVRDWEGKSRRTVW